MRRQGQEVACNRRAQERRSLGQDLRGRENAEVHSLSSYPWAAPRKQRAPINRRNPRARRRSRGVTIYLSSVASFSELAAMIARMRAFAPPSRRSPRSGRPCGCGRRREQRGGRVSDGRGGREARAWRAGRRRRQRGATSTTVAFQGVSYNPRAWMSVRHRLRNLSLACMLDLPSRRGS